MYKVDIYLAQSTASLSKDERWHGYVVACIKNGEEKNCKRIRAYIRYISRGDIKVIV